MNAESTVVLNMDQASLRTTLDQLERARHDHVQWHEHLIRTIVCRLPADHHDLGSSVQYQCRFGRWYYMHAPAELRRHPAFAAMEAAHTHFHHVAAKLLRASAARGTIATGDYDDLIDARDQLRLELDSLLHELGGFLSNRDPVTGAHGRVDILTELRDQLELAKRHVQRCCIAFMDLDNFKPVNDTYGHHAGDEVLAGVVHYVTEHLRPYDKVYRYGGDEFLISMPGAGLEAGRAVIERIREGLGRRALATDGSTAVHVTASFGLALLEPDTSAEEAIHRADLAMLEAKAAGRDRVCAWKAATG